MRAVNGGIKSYPITLVKNSVVFIEGDTNDNWHLYKGKPLIYLGVHHEGAMMFETPTDGTIYLQCPTISCIVPPEYAHHIFQEDDFTDFDDASAADTEAADFEAHRAKSDANVNNVPAILRAAALSAENGEFGDDLAGGMLIVATEDESYKYRPFGRMDKYQQVYALEWCKQVAMDVAYLSDLGDYDED